MKLCKPIKNFSWRYNISQMFGVNRGKYWPTFRIPGHNGLDLFVRDEKKGYGEPILAAHNGKAAQIVIETKWRTRGNGIYLLSEDGLFETIYWHLSEIQVYPNQEVEAGDVLGLMGNTGWVFPIPTPKNPRAGTHLHFGLKDLSKSNEYHGFVDPVPYLFEENDKLPVYWPRDLYWGKTGDDVSWLQTILKIEFPDLDFEPIGFFGNKTRKAVQRFQKRYGISPILGYVGPKTRKVLQNYSLYYNL